MFTINLLNHHLISTLFLLWWSLLNFFFFKIGGAHFWKIGPQYINSSLSQSPYSAPLSSKGIPIDTSMFYESYESVQSQSNVQCHSNVVSVRCTVSVKCTYPLGLSQEFIVVFFWNPVTIKYIFFLQNGIKELIQGSEMTTIYKLLSFCFFWISIIFPYCTISPFENHNSLW